ncbi:MAG: hypothetical protein HQK87_06920 [Nitrospinae bacterium]|nr:hypothetical protein [Nitrospinota bacterium]
MSIRDLILSDDPQKAIQELRFQWTEMASQVLTPENVVIEPDVSATPAKIGEMVFQLTNNTTLVIKVRGTDGTVRSNILTLA